MAKPPLAVNPKLRTSRNDAARLWRDIDAVKCRP